MSQNDNQHDPLGNKTKTTSLSDLAIADMEADEIWSGGSTDTAHFKQGISGRKLTALDGASASASTTVSANIAGESAATGYIDQWAYVADTTALASLPALKVTLEPQQALSITTSPNQA